MRFKRLLNIKEYLAKLDESKSQRNRIIVESEDIDQLYELMYNGLKRYSSEVVEFEMSGHRLSISYDHYLSKRVLTFLNANKKDGFIIKHEENKNISNG